MKDLPQEIISHISSYLWLYDINSLSIVCKTIYNIINNNTIFWIDIINNISKQIYFENISLINILIKKSHQMKSDEFIKYIKYLLLCIPLSLPNLIDLKILNSYRGSENIQNIELEGFDNQTYLSFIGILGESFRSIVANDCFPFLPNIDEDFQISVPFTRVVRTVDSLTKYQNNNNNNNNIFQGDITISEIGYFECKIHNEMYLPSYENNSNQSYETLSARQLFSIGLACPPFSLKTQFPGFDNFSFGYKSDDGNFYQGGLSGISFGAHHYGAGDTVGCGIIYPSLDKLGKGKIFFTKNGKIQGKLLEVASDNFFCIPWFPVVGIDSYYPITLNFGQNPFEFDLFSYEESLRQLINRKQPIIDLNSRNISKRVLKLYQDNIILSPLGISERKISSRSSSSPPPISSSTISTFNSTTTTMSNNTTNNNSNMMMMTMASNTNLTSRHSPPLNSNLRSSSRSPSRSPTTINQNLPSLSSLNNLKGKQSSRFTSTYLLHRSLRIIDAQTYKFQRDLLTDSDSENENY